MFRKFLLCLPILCLCSRVFGGTTVVSWNSAGKTLTVTCPSVGGVGCNVKVVESGWYFDVYADGVYVETDYSPIAYKISVQNITGNTIELDGDPTDASAPYYEIDSTGVTDQITMKNCYQGTIQCETWTHGTTYHSTDLVSVQDCWDCIVDGGQGGMVCYLTGNSGGGSEVYGGLAGSNLIDCTDVWETNDLIGCAIYAGGSDDQLYGSWYGDYFYVAAAFTDIYLYGNGSLSGYGDHVDAVGTNGCFFESTGGENGVLNVSTGTTDTWSGFDYVFYH